MSRAFYTRDGHYPMSGAAVLIPCEYYPFSMGAHYFCQPHLGPDGFYVFDDEIEGYVYLEKQPIKWRHYPRWDEYDD